MAMSSGSGRITKSKSRSPAQPNKQTTDKKVVSASTNKRAFVLRSFSKKQGSEWQTASYPNTTKVLDQLTLVNKVQNLFLLVNHVHLPKGPNQLRRVATETTKKILEGGRTRLINFFFTNSFAICIKILTIVPGFTTRILRMQKGNTFWKNKNKKNESLHKIMCKGRWQLI